MRVVLEMLQLAVTFHGYWVWECEYLLITVVGLVLIGFISREPGVL